MSTKTPRINRFEKNMLLNSGMHFRQRIASTATNMTAGNAYYLDRWGMRYNSNGTYTGTPTVQQVQESPNSKTKWCVGFVGTPDSSTSHAILFQRLEASEARLLALQTVSMSIWVKTDSWTQAVLRLLPASAEDNFASFTGEAGQTVAMTADGTWRKVVFENIDLSGLGSITNGLEVRIEFRSATGTGSSRYLRATQAMFHVGETALDWQMQSQSIGEELAKCQRYFYSPDPDAIGGQGVGDIIILMQAESTTTARGGFVFPVSMRAIPVVTRNAMVLSTAAGGNAGAVTTLGVTQVNKYNAFMLATIAVANLVAGNAVQMSKQATATSYIAFDAEL